MLLRKLALCVLIGASATIAEAKEWRGIVPLKSTRADVERLLGKPDEFGRYQFDNERAYIYYSTGCCEQKEDCTCRVPKDTVTQIWVNLELEVKFSEIKLDRTKYEKVKGTHLPTIVTYADHEEGIIYTVDDEDDLVIDITYLPTAKDCKDVIRKKARKT